MANEFAVLIAAAGELPASQRAVCPVKPCPSKSESPAIAAPVVDVVVDGVEDVVEVEDVVSSSDDDDGDDGDGDVVVTVVVDAGGAANGLCGADSGPPPLDTITAANPAATPSNTTVPAMSAFSVRPNRDRLTGAATGADGT